jgi:hypothetical protein
MGIIRQIFTTRTASQNPQALILIDAGRSPQSTRYTPGRGLDRKHPERLARSRPGGDGLGQPAHVGVARRPAGLWPAHPGDTRGATSIVNPSKVQFGELLKPRKTGIAYTYDTGDCREHRLTVTDQRPADPAVACPGYVAYEWPAPSEDCGAIPSFYASLKALADPDRPEHGILANWFDSYDPARFSELALKVALGRLTPQSSTDPRRECPKGLKRRAPRFRSAAYTSRIQLQLEPKTGQICGPSSQGCPYCCGTKPNSPARCSIARERARWWIRHNLASAALQSPQAWCDA